MKRFATVAPLFVLTTCVLPTIALTLCVPSSAHADPRDVVTETLSLNYIQPSYFAKLLKAMDLNARPQKMLLPTGISEITPNDKDNAVLLRGTAAAILEVKTMARLVDVKPHIIEVKARLIEIQQSADGTTSENTLLAPILVAIQNIEACAEIKDEIRACYELC